MKKQLCTWLCLGVLAVALAATGCSKKEAEDTPSANAGVSETTAAATDAGDTSETAEAVKAPESYGKVTLGSFKGLEIAKQDTSVSDADVESRIQSELEASAELVEVDREAKTGDTVNIDYVGTKDGVAFEGGTAQGYDLELGSHAFIDGFEDGLIGAKKGEKRDLNLTFPENYGAEELAGQSVVFAVTVNSVKEKRIPELTDAWVEENTLGEQKTVDEYRKAVRGELETSAEESAKSAALQELMQKVVDNSTFELDPEAVTFQYNELWDMYDQYAQMYGTTIENYFSMYGMTVEQAKEELQAYAEEICKSKLIVKEIFEKEGMSLSAEDEEAVAAAYGGDAASLKEAYGEQEFRLVCEQDKVNKFLYENAVIK